MSHGWIGVDLDGTLAKYEGWRGVDHIGEPVPLMAARVRRWIAGGLDVRIFTARAAKTQKPRDRAMAIAAIEGWCLKHLGAVLPITSEKDFAMVELWDDRCVQIIPNTGKRADGLDEPA
ncbi:MAG TPA: hypothetical protein VK204_15345 [Nocardioidaceae bacterium]|nr:hypothetical protein [Nocardioidaceae bacterium]